MSYNNEFTGSTGVYLSYEKKEVEIIGNKKYVLKEENTHKNHKKPKAIQEVEKLIAMLEAEDDESVKNLIEKKAEKIRELESNDSGITEERTALGIIQMSNEQQNAKGIKNGSILLKENKTPRSLWFTTKLILKLKIMAVLQTVDDEVVVISKTFNSK